MIYDIISVLFTAWNNPGVEKKYYAKYIVYFATLSCI